MESWHEGQLCRVLLERAAGRSPPGLLWGKQWFRTYRNRASHMLREPRSAEKLTGYMARPFVGG